MHLTLLLDNTSLPTQTKSVKINIARAAAAVVTSVVSVPRQLARPLAAAGKQCNGND
jgi:hypothetical protein